MNPPQDGYMTPEVPTILYPFWEFPRIPDRDFGFDTRQNWKRMSRPAAMIMTSCAFTADAFRRAGVSCPVTVVPTPLDPSFFELPAWNPRLSTTIECRHTILGEPASPSAQIATASDSPQAAAVPRGRIWLIAKHVFHAIYPWLDPKTVEQVARVKKACIALVRESPAKLLYRGVRGAYRRTIRRWLSLQALQKITSGKNKLLALAGRSPTVVIDPLLPSGPLTFEGLVYTSILNLGDLRKNYMDLLSAFLIAFRDRPDVTLVLKLATSPHREHHEIKILRDQYESLGLKHACRVAVITQYLDADQMRSLMQATTYYVNTSHSEGACLPLQQALAGGRPAIAPDHSAMSDYMDSEVGFVPRSHPEPTFWPHDPDKRYETERHRLVWSDIHNHFLASAELLETSPEVFTHMAEAGRRRMLAYASRAVAAEAMRQALALLPDEAPGAFAWAS
jgi:glycosyltransferase involved in cell wall biosynthesis